jgi:hypothetical protein
MLRPNPRRRRHRRHRLDTLALARHHQPGAIIVQRFRAICMTNDARQSLDKGRKPRFGTLSSTRHPSLSAEIRIAYHIRSLPIYLSSFVFLIQ